MKVKIISSSNIGGFEENINDFLTDDIHINDIYYDLVSSDRYFRCIIHYHTPQEIRKLKLDKLKQNLSIQIIKE